MTHNACHGGGGYAYVPHKKEIAHESSLVVSNPEHGLKPFERRYVPLAWQLYRLHLLVIGSFFNLLRHGRAG